MGKSGKLTGPWRSIHGAIWLIGLAILFWKGWFWPGILVLVAVSAIAEAVIQIAVPDAVEKKDDEHEKMPAPALRKIHKGAGRIFFLLMLVNSIMGFRFWVVSGDILSLRAVLHAVLALGLLIALFLKVAIIKSLIRIVRLRGSTSDSGIATSHLNQILISHSGS